MLPAVQLQWRFINYNHGRENDQQFQFTGDVEVLNTPAHVNRL